ncbi:hypothetical protein MRX96_036794 [Rhipicephalus microplus]
MKCAPHHHSAQNCVLPASYRHARGGETQSYGYATMMMMLRPKITEREDGGGESPGKSDAVELPSPNELPKKHGRTPSHLHEGKHPSVMPQRSAEPGAGLPAHDGSARRLPALQK